MRSNNLGKSRTLRNGYKIETIFNSIRNAIINATTAEEREAKILPSEIIKTWTD